MKIILFISILILGFLALSHVSASTDIVSSWLTTGDRTFLLSPSTLPLITFNPSSSSSIQNNKNNIYNNIYNNINNNINNNNNSIIITPSTRFQSIRGFGFALTGGSAEVLLSLPEPALSALLTELFSPSDPRAISISFLRLSVAASDLSSSVFSYDPSQAPDPLLLNFSLGPDLLSVVPLLSRILAINPALSIIAAPWSPPPWMKTNGAAAAGALLPEYYAVFADYLVRYVQELAAHGIPVGFITPQNEPLNPNNNPSSVMTAAQQAVFIRDHLGPAFQRSNVSTKIVCYDHNADRPEYPLEVLADPGARQYVEGSAFHLYAGRMQALSLVHALHPDKSVYFTEQWVGAPSDFGPNLLWGVANLVVGGTRNWCRCVLEWNLAANQDWEPHTPGGCSNCLGGITVVQANGTQGRNGTGVVRNEGYYMIAHASKFVPPGSVRVDSTLSEALPNTAFVTPDGELVLIVANQDTNQSLTSFVNVVDAQEQIQQQFKFNIPSQSVMTFVWPSM